MENLTADQMRQALREMDVEMANEKALLNDFQQQKEKIEQFWTQLKVQRDELKMQLRNKLRQKQDLEEKHAFELKIYKQKVKHLLHEHQAKMTDLRYDNAVSLQTLEDAQRLSEHELRLDTRTIKVVQKEMELAHNDLMRAIRVEQEKKIVAMRTEYERKAQELRDFFEQRMNSMITDMDDKRREQVARLEAHKTAYITKIMAEHKKAFADIRAYYRDVKYANLELIKGLKGDVAKLKEEDQHLQKEVDSISRINKKLSEPLEQNQAKVAALTAQLAVYEKEKGRLAAVKEALSSLEQRDKNLQWEIEIATQKLERVTGERDTLREKLEKSVYDVRQKTGFRQLVLERKLVATAQDLEKTEAALSEVLASTNLSPEVVGELRHTLEDVLMSKNKAIQRLEDELVQMKQRYAATVQLYEAKLKDHSMAVQDLGFMVVRKI